METNTPLELYWDSTYAITVALMEYHPDIIPDEVGLEQLNDLVLNLPGFQDDPDLVNERILLDIQLIWFEEFTQ